MYHFPLSSCPHEKRKTFYLPEMCKHDGKNEFRNKMKHKRFLFTLQCSGNCECVRQKRKNLKSIENNELSQYCRNITHTGRGGKRILQTCIRSHLSLLNRAATNKIAIRMKIQFRTLSRKCESYQKHFWQRIHLKHHENIPRIKMANISLTLHETEIYFRSD